MGVLQNKIQQFYNQLLDRHKFIKECFENEFTPENVDYQLRVVTFATFYHTIIEEYKYNENTGITRCHYGTQLEDVPDDIIETAEIDDNEIGQLFDKMTVVLVRFPEVTITNEKDQSTKAKNIFIKTGINFDGTLVSRDLLMNRSSYTYEHFVNNYMHSHSPGIARQNPSEFMSVCKGTGPIVTTIEKLHAKYNEAQWMSYCWDVAKYVTIESEEGIPYHRLKYADSVYNLANPVSLENQRAAYVAPNIYFDSYNITWGDIYREILNKHILTFRWNNGQWELASNMTQNVLKITDVLLSYLKNEIGENVCSSLCICNEYLGDLYYMKASTLQDVSGYQGKHVVTFKGIDYKLSIDEPKEEEPQIAYLYSLYTISSIITSLLRIINFNYGKQTNCSKG